MRTYTQYSLWNVPVNGEDRPAKGESWMFTEPFHVLDLGLGRSVAEDMVQEIMWGRPARGVGQHKIIMTTVAIRTRTVTNGDWE